MTAKVVNLLRPNDEPEPARLAVGLRFRHARLLEPSWKPGPGQRYKDGPHAVCEITAIRMGRVYFTYVNADRGRLYTSVEHFLCAGHRSVEVAR